MSTYANPAKAYDWLDGDAFRAPAGTVLPTDIFAASLSGWDAFGGIQTGFEVERTTPVDKRTVWNRKGTYKLKKGDEEGTFKMRPVDMSKATVLTLLTGGSLVAAAGGFEWLEGDEEQFAYICRVQDGTEWLAYYLEKAELGNKPTDVLNDEQLYGMDFEITPLVPDSGGRSVRKFTKSNFLV